MRLKLYYLLILHIFFVVAINAQNQQPIENSRIDIIDFTSESKSSDGNIWIIEDLHYIAASLESLISNLGLNSTDISGLNVYSASIPEGKVQTDNLKKSFPEKYQKIDFKGIIIIKLKTSKISVTDLASGNSTDGIIYVLGNNHYIATSYDSLISNLKLNPEKDIDHIDMLLASNPFSKTKIENIKSRIPEQYRNKVKGIYTIHLK